MKKNLFVLLLLSLSLSLYGCLPRPRQAATVLESSEARAAEQVARIAYHRMEIGKLQSGDYSTNVLIDLDLPQGVQWTLVSFGEGSYQLRFSSELVASYSWLVSPLGVRLETVQN